MQAKLTLLPSMLLTWCALMSATCSASAAAAGASPLYGVEIIIFRVASPAGDEDWNANLPGRGFGNGANHGGGVPSIVKVLAPADFHLGAMESTLRAGGAWRPIAHAAWIQTAANWGTHSGLALSDLGINVPGLSGSVYLERATYIHLGFDVQYQAGGNYAIKDMRSVKYNDKQYFDHPGFGILAVVTQIKRGDAAAATTPAEH